VHRVRAAPGHVAMASRFVDVLCTRDAVHDVLNDAFEPRESSGLLKDRRGRLRTAADDSLPRTAMKLRWTRTNLRVAAVHSSDRTAWETFR
jgi:hypothetical protein